MSGVAETKLLLFGHNTLETLTTLGNCLAGEGEASN